MTRYNKPSGINPVSILFLLILGAIGYGAIKFGPAYYRKFQVKGVLENCVSKFYPKRHMEPSLADQFVEELKESAVNEIHTRIGVEDAGLQVRLERTPQTLTATAIYDEIIRHPFGIQPTKLHFEPQIVGDL